MRVRAATLQHWGQDRHVVVPEDMRDGAVFCGPRELADGVVCHTVTPEWAERIADLINRYGGLPQ